MHIDRATRQRVMDAVDVLIAEARRAGGFVACKAQNANTVHDHHGGIVVAATGPMALLLERLVAHAQHNGSHTIVAEFIGVNPSPTQPRKE
jgi:hypothetical protein